MSEKTSKMVLKYHYDRMEKSTRLKFRDEFLKRSGMSLITFYDKLRKVFTTNYFSIFYKQ